MPHGPPKRLAVPVLGTTASPAPRLCPIRVSSLSVRKSGSISQVSHGMLPKSALWSRPLPSLGTEGYSVLSKPGGCCLCLPVCLILARPGALLESWLNLGFFPPPWSAGHPLGIRDTRATALHTCFPAKAKEGVSPLGNRFSHWPAVESNDSQNDFSKVTYN